MDKPQYQVPVAIYHSYRFMKYPLPKGMLQELYPGRLMSPYYHFTGDNISSENPGGLMKTRENLAILTGNAALEQEAMNRKLGGINPNYQHASIEPEGPITDLSTTIITNNSVGTRGQTDIEKHNSFLPRVNVLQNQSIKDAIIINENQNPHLNGNYGEWEPHLDKECYTNINNSPGTPITGNSFRLLNVVLIFIGLMILFLLFGGLS